MKTFIIFLLLIIIAAGVVLYLTKESSRTISSSVSQEPVGEVEERFARYAREVEKIADSLGKTNAQVFIARALDFRITTEELKLDYATAIIDTLQFDKAGELLPGVRKCEPFFAELKKATTAEVNICPEIVTADAPIPNFLNCKKLCKMLLIKGMALEQQGKLDDALDAYLTTAQLGGLIGGKNGPLIARLVGIAIENLSYKLLQNFVIMHPSDPSQMKKTIDTLITIEAKHTPLVEFVKAERKRITALLGQSQLVLKVDISRDFNRLWDYLIQVSDMSYPDFRKEKPMIKISKMEENLPSIVHPPNLLESKVRHHWAATNNRLIRTMAALQLYYNHNKYYPESLSELAPAYLAAIPKDYFSESDFIYRRSGSDYYLYSVGPDMIDDGKRIVYDPTNGTISAGDIIGR